jgi:hypothetical protein
MAATLIELTCHLGRYAILLREFHCPNSIESRDSLSVQKHTEARRIQAQSLVLFATAMPLPMPGWGDNYE